MAAITASLVKELRDMTSAGMMDCKKALVEADGDLNKAVEILREKGLSKAAKKAGRIAAMGLIRIALSDDNKTAAIVEVNSETDFVAKNDEFIGFVDGMAKLALKAESNDMDAFKAMPYENSTAQEVLTAMIAKIGENMSIRRIDKVSGDVLAGKGVGPALVHDDADRSFVEVQRHGLAGRPKGDPDVEDLFSGRQRIVGAFGNADARREPDQFAGDVAGHVPLQPAGRLELAGDLQIRQFGIFQIKSPLVPPFSLHDPA